MNFEQPDLNQETIEPKAKPASLDDVLGEMRDDLGDVSEAVEQEIKNESEEKEAQQEKERQSLESLKPKLDEFMEMVDSQKVFNGEKIYFALTGDLEGFIKSENEKRRRQFAIDTLYEEMAEEYKEKTDRPLYISSIPSEFQDKKYTYVDGSYQKLDGKTEEDYESDWKTSDEKHPPAGLMNAMMNDAQGKIGATMTGFNEGRPVRSHDPEEYIENLEKLADYVVSKEYHFNQGTKEYRDPEVVVSESKKRIYSRGIDTEAQGIALGALQSEDIAVAAKALALAEKIEPTSATTLQRMRESLGGLSPEKKQKFLSLFEAEKSK